jgi:hypothetical protein
MRIYMRINLGETEYHISCIKSLRDVDVVVDVRPIDEISNETIAVFIPKTVKTGDYQEVISLIASTLSLRCASLHDSNGSAPNIRHPTQPERGKLIAKAPQPCKRDSAGQLLQCDISTYQVGRTQTTHVAS